MLGYLEANGFTNYIASGGGRDFMRPISQEVYGIPRDRVIGSATTFQYTSNDSGGTITHKAEADYLDDGPQKPIRIWSRTGRRPLLAAGNSNGDLPMLEFAQHQDKPSLRLLVLHDDGQREFDYTSGAEQALERAADERLDGRQHEERLGHRFLKTGPGSIYAVPRKCLPDRAGAVVAETRGAGTSPGKSDAAAGSLLGAGAIIPGG